jgi:UDP-3-O-acyl N-acetylglucosamine deacetylase
MNVFRERPQRTIRRPVGVEGVGFVTGALVRLRFLPAPADTGVVFVRTDLPDAPLVPACLGAVTGVQRRTTLGQPPAQVELVEHILAALAGLRIDNCRVEVDAPEPPGLDGSALRFVKALRDAGLESQPGRRTVWRIDSPVHVESGGATLGLYPLDDSAAAHLRISYFLDYGPTAPMPPQVHTATITPSEFAADLAPCRTFLLESEALELRRQGLGARTTTRDLVVFGPRGPIDNVLRFADEPARHKVLDLVGDLALLGVDLVGHVVAYRSGHPLNIALARELEKRLPVAQRRAA